MNNLHHLHLLLLLSFIFFDLLINFSSPAANPYLGIHPKDEQYYVGLEVIKCKDDESRYFTLDRLNDGFCDCVDGTDEPGTSACPNSKFYCRNFGSEPKLLFSSRVNDRLCDCCDGSDEYDGSVSCPNTCFKDGNVVNDNYNINSERASLSNTSLHNKNSTVNLEDLIHKAKDLRIIVIVEVVIVISLVAFRLFCWRIKHRRRHNRLKGLPT